MTEEDKRFISLKKQRFTLFDIINIFNTSKIHFKA
jgi:hypothetical protein